MEIEDNEIKKDYEVEIDRKFWSNIFEYRNQKVVTEHEYKEEAMRQIGFKLKLFRYLSYVCAVLMTMSILGLITYYIRDPVGMTNFFDGEKNSLNEWRKMILILYIAIDVVASILGIFFKLYPQYLIDKKITELKTPKVFGKIKEKENENKFEVLSNINIEHLNKYYKQTYDQCDKSFTIAKMASNASYIILASGIIIFFISIFILKDEQSRLIMFGITTGAGVVIKIVSSLYFYMYNNSVSKLSEYHDKLYAIQNILISLELSNQISDTDKKDDIKADMIKRLLEIGIESKNKEIK